MHITYAVIYLIALRIVTTNPHCWNKVSIMEYLKEDMPDDYTEELLLDVFNLLKYVSIRVNNYMDLKYGNWYDYIDALKEMRSVLDNPMYYEIKHGEYDE